jgi:hypothetical protein
MKHLPFSKKKRNTPTVMETQLMISSKKQQLIPADEQSTKSTTNPSR